MADTYTVQRDVTVGAHARAVYDEVVDLRRWQSWSPWEGLDPALRRRYEGSSSGPGAVYRWKGNRKAGHGRTEITDVEPDARVVIDLVAVGVASRHRPEDVIRTSSGP